MNGVKVEVKSMDTTERTFKNDDGTVRVLVEQQGFFHRGDGCVFPIGLRLQQGAAPFAPGEYGIESDSFYAGKYGRIEFAPRLKAAVPGVRAAVKSA